MSITAILADTDANKPLISIQVQLQACNDKHCLAPETINLAVQSED